MKLYNFLEYKLKCYKKILRFLSFSCGNLDFYINIVMFVSKKGVNEET